MQLLKQIKANRSRLTVGLIGFVFLFIMLAEKQWNRPDAIRHDMTSYYGYLPAVFINHDLTLSYSDQPEYEGQYAWVVGAEKGKILRMTMGLAVMETPFFAVADVGASLFGLERKAYSPWFFFFMYLGAVFYLTLAVKLCIQNLKYFFSSEVATLTTLALVFGTNLYYYSFCEALMSHVFNFFLYTWLINRCIHWHLQPNAKDAAAMGLAIGLLILIRPIHILALLIPLLYQGGSVEKWLKLRNRGTHIIWMALIIAACVFPQLAYWKYLSGNWFVYTYRDEHFFFNQPMIWKGLLGFRKGWLIYSPIMFLSLFGLIWSRRRLGEFKLVFLLLLPCYGYVVFSWWCWWYGGSFGSRPMIDLLPLMAFPLANFFQFMTNRYRRGFNYAVLTVLAFCYLNIFQIRQYQSSELHWDSMTRELYFKIFLNNTWPDNYENLLSHPDYEAAKKGTRDI
ncbi:MAG: hypothetical protein GC180_05140 [Bacteroidetes bacterium]|nr:hypothetical protein [Bacteroidota bacterium]